MLKILEGKMHCVGYNQEKMGGSYNSYNYSNLSARFI